MSGSAIGHRTVPRSLLGAGKGELGQGICGEKADVGRIIARLEPPSNDLGLEGQKERHTAARLAGVDVDDSADRDLKAGLFQCLTTRRGSRILAGIHETGRQRPLARGGLDTPTHQEQPALLVVDDDADADLRVAEVEPTAALATLWRARRRPLRQATATGGAETCTVVVVVCHRCHRTRKTCRAASASQTSRYCVAR